MYLIMILYHFLDWFFILFHLLVTMFNLLGWIWRKTRKWNLITLIITGFFWFVIGIFYGFGYCPLTDWHFQVLYKIGEYPDTNSYIGYIIIRFFGLSINSSIVDYTTLSCFLVAFILSIVLNIRDRRNMSVIISKNR